ncbi:MAG TPA: response regulator, partial [Nitrospira sp.]|nr:response regulator [Nitrospira sp.]
PGSWIPVLLSIRDTPFAGGRYYSIVVSDLREQKREERLRALAIHLEETVAQRTQELVQSRDQLRALAAKLNLAEQRERKRIATELHDYLQQMIVLAKLQLAQGRRSATSADSCLGVMAKVDGLLSDALAYTRTLVAELSPPVLHHQGLAAALKWLGEYMRKHDLDVAVAVPDDDGVHVADDHKALLFQSIRELLFNALKHAGTEKASITMSCLSQAVRIEVSDEGKGFEPDRVQDGSRFGLLSIKERMKSLGGWFDVQSAPGQGTTCILELPFLPQTVKPGEPLTPAMESLHGDHWSAKNGKIRVVLADDHAMVRQGLKTILASYPDLDIVAEASDGLEALGSVEQYRPAVVVMDINMPNMNGIECTSRIKARYPEVPVIGLSVNAGSDNLEAMRKAGACYLMTKEAAVDDLYSAILKAVKQAV